MNEQERSELARLKQRHARLEQEMILLSRELHSLERQVSTPPPSPNFAPPEDPPALSTEKARVEPIAQTALPPQPVPPIIAQSISAPEKPEEQIAAQAPPPERRLSELPMLKGW